MLRKTVFFGILAALILTITPSIVMAGGGRGNPGPDDAEEHYVYVKAPFTGVCDLRLERDLYNKPYLYISGTVCKVNDGKCCIIFNDFLLRGPEDLADYVGELTCSGFKVADFTGIWHEFLWSDPPEGIVCNCGSDVDVCEGEIMIETLAINQINCEDDDESGSASVLMMEVIEK
jgi:hypothetical protein